MRAILRIVPMYILVVTLATGMRIPKFSEEAYKALGIMNPTEEITAELLNPHHTVHLKLMNQWIEDEVNFELDHHIKLHDHAPLGLKMSRKEEVIDVSSFSIKTSSVSNGIGTYIPFIGHRERVWAAISIVLCLKPQHADTFIMEIPVFMVPDDKLSQSEKTNPSDWQKWANAHKVGINTWNLEDALKTSIHSKKIALNFMWLADIMRHKIYPHSRYHYVKGERVLAYATRPLVVAENTGSAFINVLKAFTVNAASAD